MKQIITVIAVLLVMINTAQALSEATIKPPYPKEDERGTNIVWICPENGETYNWWYGDNHKLLTITNKDTYHVHAPNTKISASCKGNNKKIDNIVKSDNKKNTDHKITNRRGTHQTNTKHIWKLIKETNYKNIICQERQYTIEHRDGKGTYKTITKQTYRTTCGKNLHRWEIKA